MNGPKLSVNQYPKIVDNSFNISFKIKKIKAHCTT